MLYVVPTPIGNLDDITIRAKKVFDKAKFVLCEDGRITSKLFRLLGITNQPTFINLVKNNQFNTSGIQFALTSNLGNQTIVDNLESDNMVIALVSDAGTPAVSDPGYEVIRMVQELELQYTVLPGATAFVPALVASGMAGSSFEFVGFLPLKKGRQSAWQDIRLRLENNRQPIILYESVHRITKFIQESQQFLSPTTRIWIGQELTKSHETYYQATIATIDPLRITQKGEFVIVLQGY